VSRAAFAVFKSPPPKQSKALAVAVLANRFHSMRDETLKKEDVERVDGFTVGFEGTRIRAVVHEDRE
jgi:hypothetical protein